MGLRQRGSVIGNYATASSNLATGIWTAKEAYTLQKQGRWQAAPSFALTSSAATINEGSSVTFTLSTTGIQNGTVIPYTVTGSNVNVLDFTSGNLTGNFIIVNGTGTASFSAANDVTTEGTETIQMSTLGLTSNVTINDTSKEADAQFPYTTLLLKGDGTNNSQNNTFLDSSTNNFALTRNGNSTQGTFTPYGSNWSNYFDGTSYYGYALNNASSPLNFALNQDFTMELWAYSTSSSADYTLVNFGTYRQAYGSEFVVWITNKSASIFISGGSGTSYTEYKAFYPASSTLALNTWNHIAVVRSSNNLKVYINGVGGTAVSAPGAAQPNSDRYDLAGPHGLWFGVNATNWTAFSPTIFKGYISNYRYNVGTALYTSDFTPPTLPLSTISGTQVLSLNTNRFKDSSNNNLTTTIVQGYTFPQRFSPFSPTAEYDANTIGGSGYFDGTADVVTGPNNNSKFQLTNNGGTGLTIEAWIYPTTAGTFRTIGSYYSYTTGGAEQGWVFRLNTSNQLAFRNTFDSVERVGGTVLSNTWSHVAGVVSGGTFFLYLNGISVGSATGGVGNQSYTGSTFGIGGLKSDGAYTLYNFQGYISDLRVANTAVYSGNFTPPSSPLLTSGTSTIYSSNANVNVTFAAANTSLLTKFTNAGIVDSSMMNNLETVADSKISTANSKFGGTAMYFDGTGDYLSFINKTNRSLYFSSGNWTVEMWAYHNTTGTYDHTLLGGTSFYDVIFGVFSFGSQLGFWNNNTFYEMYASSNLTPGVWRHIAYVRNSNTVTLYINGTSVSSTGLSGSMKEDGSNDFTISVVGQNMNGYIDDLRVTKGYARYTANFTPPTKTFPLQ